MKSYFYIKCATGKVDKRFRREVYFPLDNSESDYINDLYEILQSKLKQNCIDLVEQKKSQWDDQFVRYFEKNVEQKLDFFCFWSIDGKCTYNEVNGLITNQSEGFNLT